MTLSIIIVNWNVRHFLEKCLSSVFRNTAEDFDYEIIIVDNNSARDDSKSFLANLQAPVNCQIILNNQNLGFARANNQALQQAQGEYILFLNPDVEIIEKGSLEKAVNLMMAHQNWGILGCHLWGADQKTQASVRSFPRLCSQIMIFLKLHHLFSFQFKPLRHYFLPNFNYQKQAEVDQVMGAFLLTRRQILTQVGPLDENFYIWFEEVDFCQRVKKAGWKVVYSPEPTIIHYGSQSFAQVLSWKKQKIYNQSALYYFRKYHPWKARILNLFSPLSLILAAGQSFIAFLKKILNKNNVQIH
jgi:hypothetical protein